METNDSNNDVPDDTAMDVVEETVKGTEVAEASEDLQNMSLDTSDANTNGTETGTGIQIETGTETETETEQQQAPRRLQPQGESLDESVLSSDSKEKCDTEDENEQQQSPHWLRPQGDCWDEPAMSSDSKTTEEDEEKDTLQPGDHVTRWEMLPIAWPIQVHGIVLNVHEDTIVLVDFGLSAAPTDKTKSSPASSPNAAATSTSSKGNDAAVTTEKDSSNNGNTPKTKQLEQAIRNFKIGGRKREKNRLNINILYDPKDIAKWKKVNYEKSWFGGGASAKNREDGTEGTPSSSKAQRTKTWLNKMATSVKEKARPGLANLKEKARPGLANLKVRATSLRISKPSLAATEDESKSSDTNDSTVASTSAAECAAEVSTADNNIGPSWLQSAASQDSQVSSATTDLKASSSQVSEGSSASDFTNRQMNPKMKELLQRKQEENPPKTMNSAMAKVLNQKVEESQFEKKKKESLAKLPKADPTKLVLARTHWLLEHGENILPPYHAFSANSECLAVFCKTGKWNTLQADVFLHSTAIGNAKTMGATTIAVAASAPLLAPAVAVAGIGAVAAPWFYLNKHKNKAVDSQQKLTDDFWAQADPEVFVACIEAWSKDLLGMTDTSERTEDSPEGGEEDHPQEEQKETIEEKKESSPPVVFQV